MWSDNETDKDLIGFSVHASLIKDVITNDNNLPLTMGLYGDWGSGKSSVLKILKKQIEEDALLKDDTIVIYFDGWTFEGYDDAKSALMQEIILQLINNKRLNSDIKGKVKAIGENLLKSVNWMRVLQWSTQNVILPGIAAHATGGISLVPFLLSKFKENKGHLEENLTGENAADFLNSIIKSNPDNDKISVVREFREKFKGLLDATDKKRLVVLIDDLDRCTPRRIIDNLEAIKLFLNVEKTAFVIAADEQIVSNAIKIEYTKDLLGGQENDKNNIGKAYMEKLIQIPYKLPRLTHKEVETYISLLFCQSELSNESFNKIQAHYLNFIKEHKFEVYGWNNIDEQLDDSDKPKIKEMISFISQLSNMISICLKGNPRLIKRFLNAYELRLSLLKIGGIDDQKIKQALIKLMILEYNNQTLFEQLYDWQQQAGGKPEEIVEIENLSLKDNDTYPENIKAWNDPMLKQVVSIKPLFSEIDLRVLYWVSREKLSDAIGGASLISSKVRTLFNDVMVAATDNILEHTYIPKIKILNGNDLQDFYTLLNETIMANPKDKKGYNIYSFCIKDDIELAYSQFLNILSRINTEKIPASLSVKFNVIKNKYSGDTKFVSLISENGPLIRAMQPKTIKQ